MLRLGAALLAAASLLLAGPGAVSAPNTSATRISEMLFGNVDRFWSQQVAALGGRYRPPKLVFFTQPIGDVCDVQAALSGPFYCPVNETVYLDQPFLQRFAMLHQDQRNLALGYVVAHEVAHHIQNVIGTTAMVDQARSRSTPELAKRTLITLELQADCYAGLWAHWAESLGTLRPPNDVAASLDAVATIAQEEQRRLAAGQEMLDPFTYESSAQRLKWFRRGLDSGRFGDCDTFGVEANGSL